MSEERGYPDAWLDPRSVEGKCADLAARLSAMEARERHRAQALRLLHRWMCAPLRQEDRVELTVALAKADPDYLPSPKPTPTPGPSPEVIARVREALQWIADAYEPGMDCAKRATEALRLLDGAA